MISTSGGRVVANWVV
jgi:hypothetical protein